LEPDPEAIKRATGAMLKALEDCAVLDDVHICLIATATLVGCLVTAADDPERALGLINKIARGVMDGSLLTE
jgi:hypothetical protein